MRSISRARFRRSRATALPVAAPRAVGAARCAHDFSAERLVAPPTDGWPTNGGNLYNQRYSPLNQIDTSNVAQLKGVWRTRLRGSGAAPQYSGEAQPVVHDGVAYVSTGANDVFALSIDTRRDPLAVHRESARPICRRFVAAGTTAASRSARTRSSWAGSTASSWLSIAQTGAPSWTIQAERRRKISRSRRRPSTTTASSSRASRAPIAARAAASKPTTPTTAGSSGRSTRFRGPASRGTRRGRRTTTRGSTAAPPCGRRRRSIRSSGSSISRRAMPGPTTTAPCAPATICTRCRSSRSSSKTGKYRWHFQQVHHDIWDYDSSNPVVLMDLTLDGRARKAIVEVGKTGWAYILDRETGEPIVGIDERPVPQEPRQATAATQPFPRGDAVVPQHVDIAPEGIQLVNDGRIFTPFVGEDPTIVKPGIWGGANWPPSAYDPRAQHLFVCASSVVNGFTGGGDPNFVPPVRGRPLRRRPADDAARAAHGHHRRAWT